MGRIGLLATAGSAYFEEGLCMFDLKEALSKGVSEAVEILREKIEVIYPGLVTNLKEAERVTAKFRDEEIDLLIICEALWTEDAIPLVVVDGLKDVPLLAWMYAPTKGIPEDLDGLGMLKIAGINGTVEITYTLKRIGRKFGFVFGLPQEDKVLREISEYAQAAALVKKLRSSHVGWLPYRCGWMEDTFQDEFRLTRQIGPKVSHVSVLELISEMDQVPEEEIEARVEGWKRDYRIVEPDDEELFKAAKLTLGLERIVDKYKFNAISIMSFMELTAATGITPFAPIEKLEDRGIMVGAEGDLSAAVAMMILHELTGEPVQFAEFMAFDKEENTVLVGHSAPAGVRMARSPKEVSLRGFVCPLQNISLPGFPAHGVSVEYIAKPGKVTMLNITCTPEGYKFVIFRGEALDTPPRPMNMPHAIVKLERPLDEFFNDLIYEGMEHHFGLVHGDVVGQLEKLADLLGVKKVLL